MSSVQNLPDIEIPDIEISEGWFVSEVETIQDCDDAFAYLTSACAAIEAQIESETLRPVAEQRGAWMVSAKAAFRFKKAALQIVQQKRGAIHAAMNIKASQTGDRALLAFIRSTVPAAQWLAWVTAHNAAAYPAEKSDAA